MNRHNTIPDPDKMKVKYLHGRPSAHYTHANFARQVGADFEFIDFKYRWQDQKRNFFYIIYSWFYCAKNYTNRKLYNLFLVDNLHFPPVIMKYLFLRRRRQKIVVYLGSHTLYFMYARKFSKLNLWAHKIALRSYDAIICEGEMAKFFATSVLKKRIPPLYTVFNGIPDSQNLADDPRIINNGKKLLFIGSYDSEFRFQYKGVDIMLEAFALAFKQDPELRFTLVGSPDRELLEKQFNRMDEDVKKAITILDYSSNLSDIIFEHDVYLHCSRGDAFPTTVLIALSAGMPTIVNELNGTRDIVSRVNARLVTGQEPAEIAERICWLVSLSPGEKEKIKETARAISKEYSEKKAVSRFTSVFEQIKQDIFDIRQ